MSKRSPKKHRRTLPALGLASVSFSMASGACAVIGHANANTPPQQTHEIFLSEEEISDVSLATFHVFDKENSSPLRLARGGGGCGGGSAVEVAAMAVAAAVMVAAAAAAVAVMAAAAAAGVTWVALTWAAARVVVMSAALAVVASAAVTSAVVTAVAGAVSSSAAAGCGGCGGCGGCSGDTCWIWTPGGWIYSCGAESYPPLASPSK